MPPRRSRTPASRARSGQPRRPGLLFTRPLTQIHRSESRPPDLNPLTSQHQTSESDPEFFPTSGGFSDPKPSMLCSLHRVLLGFALHCISYKHSRSFFAP